jgi:hypothetical protein
MFIDGPRDPALCYRWGFIIKGIAWQSHYEFLLSQHTNRETHKGSIFEFPATIKPYPHPFVSACKRSKSTSCLLPSCLFSFLLCLRTILAINMWHRQHLDHKLEDVASLSNLAYLKVGCKLSTHHPRCQPKN